jgi:hypothetical protein
MYAKFVAHDFAYGTMMIESILILGISRKERVRGENTC